METRTVKVPNIGCNGCVSTIKAEVTALPGVTSADGSVDAQTMTITWDAPASWDVISAKMEEIEYAPAETV
jgi:copper chaperone CopZ